MPSIKRINLMGRHWGEGRREEEGVSNKQKKKMKQLEQKPTRKKWYMKAVTSVCMG